MGARGWLEHCACVCTAHGRDTHLLTVRVVLESGALAADADAGLTSPKACLRWEAHLRKVPVPHGFEKVSAKILGLIGI